MNPWLPEKKVMKGFLRIFDPEMSFWLVQNPSEKRFPTSGNDSRISQRLMTVCLDD